MTTKELNRQQLHTTALKAPKKSGVYLWRDADSRIIYVGKAKNLKNRLTSYFAGNKDIKTRILISKAVSIEYITTSNEYEALLLENTLIKQHSPRYNISLKDGKSYPVLRITNESYPRLFKTRTMIQDGSRYFGPYPNVTALDAFIETLQRHYKLRRCKKLRTRKAPCMYYHIGQCFAPCCNKISQKDYIDYIDEIVHLLEGEQNEAIKNMQKEMKTAASLLQFEKAARIRDGISALKTLYLQNSVEDFDPQGRDYIARANEGPLVSFVVLRMRGGKLVSKDTYRAKSLNTDEETVLEFLLAYYTEKEQIPARIFVETESGLALARQFFEEKLGAKPSICVAKDGAEDSARHLAALEMARQNAKEDIVRRLRERGDIPAMDELMHLLKLPHLPVRIEGFDIAHLGGNLPVASLISFYNGNPDKKNYRYFRLKTTDGIIDDFASMREASFRRYSRLIREQKELPDLIVIDGGIGQVNAVQGVLDELNVAVPIIGLAKRDEEVYLPHNSTPIHLPRSSDALRLLQRVRDETHRFATTQNQKLRTKVKTTLSFEALPHVGKSRAQTLLKNFGTLQNMLVASPEAVYQVAKVSSAQGKELLDVARKLVDEENVANGDNLRATNNLQDANFSGVTGLQGAPAPRADNSHATNKSATHQSRATNKSAHAGKQSTIDALVDRALGATDVKCTNNLQQ